MSKIIKISSPIIDKGELTAVMSVLKSGMITQGIKVQELEKNFRQICNTKYAVATNNGTSALHTALHAIGVKPGDEVITTPFTFIATANAIIMAGAKPVFVDVDIDTYNIDPGKLESAITKKTKAILVVNLYGQSADYKKINFIAKKHNIVVVEDAAQSINSTYYGKKSGDLADIACFSLYATKNIMCGEGGMITTNNKKYYERAHLFRQHGQDENRRYEYYELGYNYRMMDIQAAIALIQIKRLNQITKKRQNNARIYYEELNNIPGLILPKILNINDHVYHQFTVRITQDFVTNRAQLVDHLKQKGISVGIYYPKSLHLVPHISAYGYKMGDFPKSEKLSEQVLSLPIHPLLSKSDLDYIISNIKIYGRKN